MMAKSIDNCIKEVKEGRVAADQKDRERVVQMAGQNEMLERVVCKVTGDFKSISDSQMATFSKAAEAAANATAKAAEAAAAEAAEQRMSNERIVASQANLFEKVISAITPSPVGGGGLTRSRLEPDSSPVHFHSELPQTVVRQPVSFAGEQLVCDMDPKKAFGVSSLGSSKKLAADKKAAIKQEADEKAAKVKKAGEEKKKLVASNKAKAKAAAEVKAEVEAEKKKVAAAKKAEVVEKNKLAIAAKKAKEAEKNKLAIAAKKVDEEKKLAATKKADEEKKQKLAAAKAKKPPVLSSPVSTRTRGGKKPAQGLQKKPMKTLLRPHGRGISMANIKPTCLHSRSLLDDTIEEEESDTLVVPKAHPVEQFSGLTATENKVCPATVPRTVARSPETSPGMGELLEEMMTPVEKVEIGFEGLTSVTDDEGLSSLLEEGLKLNESPMPVVLGPQTPSSSQEMLTEISACGSSVA